MEANAVNPASHRTQETPPISMQVVVTDENTGESIVPKLHYFFDGEDVPDELEAASSLIVSLGPDRRSVERVQQLNAEDVDVTSSVAYSVDNKDELVVKIRGSFPEVKVAAGLIPGATALMDLLNEYQSSLDLTRTLLLSRDTMALMNELEAQAPAMDIGRSRGESLVADVAVQANTEEDEKPIKGIPGVLLRSDSLTSLARPPPLEVSLPHRVPPNAVVASPFRRTFHAPREPWSPTTAELSRSLSETALAHAATTTPPHGSSKSAVFPDNAMTGALSHGPTHSMPVVGSKSTSNQKPALAPSMLDADYESVVARLRKGFHYLRGRRGSESTGPVKPLRLDIDG